MKGEKARSANFTPLEIQFLVELVSEKIDVLESKLNDNMSVMRKNKGWEKVHAEFSSNPGCQNRSMDQLKGLWKRLVKVSIFFHYYLQSIFCVLLPPSPPPP